jgi:cytochrome c biogenesis protein CcdA
MFDGFRIIFWGIFFITFHINLGPIAILPVFIGYMTVSRGIDHLLDEFSSSNFMKARKISFCLTLLGVFSFLLIWSPDQNSIIMTYYSLLFSVLELFLVYYLLEGSIEKLEMVNGMDEARDYRSEQRTYTVFMTIFIIGMCIAITIGETTLSFVVIIVGLVLRLWLMMMLGRLKRSFPELEEGFHTPNIMEENDGEDDIIEDEADRYED